MANRHKKQSSGAGASAPVVYGNPKVVAAAKAKNRGGSVTIGKAFGGAATGRADKKARGGSVAHKASGGSATKNPWSSAHRG